MLIYIDIIIGYTLDEGQRLLLDIDFREDPKNKHLC
jgi:hypothetical protein